VKRYKSTTILGGGPPGKIVQCQSFNLNPFISKLEKKIRKDFLSILILKDRSKYYIILRIRNKTLKADQIHLKIN
jgi:hypothetical protein